MTSDPPRKRWTRAEYRSLPAEIEGYERLELIEGELISKRGKKRPHVNAVAALHTWLSEVFGPRFVEIGAPIDVAPEDNHWSEPEPDIMVTRQDVLQYPTDSPPPSELPLVEVADSTLGFDLKTKALLYARAGIPEYWVVDISGRRIIVHRESVGGVYGQVVAYGRDESVAPHEQLPIGNLG